MIPLVFEVESDAAEPFVTRLKCADLLDPRDSIQLSSNDEISLWSGSEGLFELNNLGHAVQDDVILVDPHQKRAERLIRANSKHNTLLVTERCDQLCVMCSQPPKKTHIDRFAYFETACLLAPTGQTIGISGGEPTLFMDQLLELIEHISKARPDLSFHVLTNAQHFTREHLDRLTEIRHARVAWGIPLYSANSQTHDAIVGRKGAFDKLVESLGLLLLAGARIELRTVMMQQNVSRLAELSQFVVRNLAHIEQWSIMGLENIGFARNRWDDLYCDTRKAFPHLAEAINIAVLHGLAPRVFNIPLCHLPENYRKFAVASISDWKQRFGKACGVCSVRTNCSGFFEWHPDYLVEEVEPL